MSLEIHVESMNYSMMVMAVVVVEYEVVALINLLVDQSMEIDYSIMVMESLFVH
jgi:hypothetical protein